MDLLIKIAVEVVILFPTRANDVSGVLRRDAAMAPDLIRIMNSDHGAVIGDNGAAQTQLVRVLSCCLVHSASGEDARYSTPDQFQHSAFIVRGDCIVRAQKRAVEVNGSQ